MRQLTSQTMKQLPMIVGMPEMAYHETNFESVNLFTSSIDINLQHTFTIYVRQMVNIIAGKCTDQESVVAHSTNQGTEKKRIAQC